ncbi:hypothetical protein GCM10027190_05080 [Spirosoma areae]
MALLWACRPAPPSDLERNQAANIRLTKTLHDHLNHHEWQAVERLCAETVRYRSRGTHFAEVEEPKAQFLTHYRMMLTRQRPGSLEIRQLYCAGGYHVIVEGIAAGEPPDSPLPVCLIYTIEKNHITRLHAY